MLRYYAYKYVAMIMMLCEANYCARHLELPIKLPITETDLRLSYVGDFKVSGFCGTVETQTYSFSFYGSGVIRSIVKYSTNNIPMREKNLRLSKMTSLINTNDAYVIAKRWLNAVEININLLEKSNKAIVTQRYYFSKESPLGDGPLVDGGPRVLLPVFDVKWGDQSKPAVSVLVFGPTRELLSLRVEDVSFSRRIKQPVANVDLLLKISDEEFLSWNAFDRSNLVWRSAANKDLLTNIVIGTEIEIEPARKNTPARTNGVQSIIQ